MSRNNRREDNVLQASSLSLCKRPHRALGQSLMLARSIWGPVATRFLTGVGR